MSGAKRQLEEQEALSGVIEQIAVTAGLGQRCERHPEVFISEGMPDPDALTLACKIMNAGITEGRIQVSSLSRRDVTDLLKDLVEQAPEACPECERLFGKDD